MDVYSEISRFYADYRGKKLIIGKSAEGRNLYAMFAGEEGGAVGISQYAMHAREWITALLALEHIERGVFRGGTWFIPLVNPDGALLSLFGLDSVSGSRRAFLKELNGGEDFSLWKTNAEGVDLNVNFPARWGTGRRNITRPASENYIGTEPLCALETLALRNFTLAVRPDYTVSYHTKGEEIYWRFHQPLFRALRDKRLAVILSRSTGYPLKEARASAGGYKDWCVEKLKIPAFTVEAGSDGLAHPLGLGALPEIVRRNKDAVFDLSKGL